MKQLFIRIATMFHPAINEKKAEIERLNTALSKAMTDYGYQAMELNKTRFELTTVRNELTAAKNTNANYTRFALNNIEKLTTELAERETVNRGLKEELETGRELYVTLVSENEKIREELNAAIAENRIADTLAVKEKIGKPFRTKKGNKSKQY